MSSRQHQLQTRDDEGPVVAAANHSCNAATIAATREQNTLAMSASYDKPLFKTVALRLRREGHSIEEAQQQSYSSNDELRDSPLTCFTSSFSSAEESVIDEEQRDGAPILLSFPSTISMTFPVGPSWTNLDYIEVDDTFDESGRVGRRNSSSTTNNNCVSFIGSTYCSSTANNHLMTVDLSPSVEPLSWKEKILQPALGCDEMAVESFIDYTTCNCTNESIRQSSNEATCVVMGEDRTKRVSDNASKKKDQKCHQRNHDEQEALDGDEGEEVGIVTFIDMIKMIFTTRWRDICDELLLK